MTESPVISIRIQKEIPFEGPGDSLDQRMRNVRLKGFPDVKIYENSSFDFSHLNPKQIQYLLHTPQTCVYRTPNLSRIEMLANLFREQGIDITSLNSAYDYTAKHQSGEESEWTLLPPVVEKFRIPNINGRLNYQQLIGLKLQQYLKHENLSLNQQAHLLPHTGKSGEFNLINDGSHRIHYAFENNGIKVLIAEGMTPGFPYYAAPQKYDVSVFESREDALKKDNHKIHILESPGHKALYRLFPSGGIKSGDVRPPKNN